MLQSETFVDLWLSLNTISPYPLTVWFYLLVVNVRVSSILFLWGCKGSEINFIALKIMNFQKKLLFNLIYNVFVHMHKMMFHAKFEAGVITV